MKKVIVILAFLIPSLSLAQEEAGSAIRIWHSAYINKKISPRWSAQSYLLVATRNIDHQFWLSQIDLSVMYRSDRYWTFKVSYGRTSYAFNNWWEDHYTHDPDILNLISFQNLGFEIQHRKPINHVFYLENRLAARHFIPSYEKYQTRINYTLRIGSQKRFKFLQSKYYLQGSLYYFLNGQILSQTESNIPSANGLHRFRMKFNANFKPKILPKNTSFSLYFMWNKEFNIGDDPNGLNRIVQNATVQDIPFNNYTALGFQINFFL